jgi:hypothetical protein
MSAVTVPRFHYAKAKARRFPPRLCAAWVGPTVFLVGYFAALVAMVGAVLWVV